MESATPHRPGPLRWLAYAYGAGLPPRYRAWVLFDTTCSTWLLRHVVRSLLMIAPPVAAVIVFLPAPVGLRVLTAFTAGACALMFMVVHTIETTERRVVKAGFPGGTAEAMRSRRGADAQRLANTRRRERIQERRDRR